MQIIAAHKEYIAASGARSYRATIRIDSMVHVLAGVYPSAKEAQDVADAMLTSIRRSAAATLRRISVSHAMTRSGAVPLPISLKPGGPA